MENGNFTGNNLFIEKQTKKILQVIQIPSVWNVTVEGIDSTKAFGYGSYE
jgi:hypothetical protein